MKMKKGKLTKNFQNLSFAILIVLIAFVSVVSCENTFINSILPSRDPKTVKYESVDAEGRTYILVITGKTSRAYTGAAGDSYVLTIKQAGQPDKESKGTVTTISADGMTLKPTKADESFGVSISSGKMTAITGTITLDDGGTITAPGAVMPIYGIFTSVADMAAWLKAQPDNSTATAYNVKLNISDFTFNNDYTRSDIANALITNKTKYVSLDLSGSTFTDIPDTVFWDCTSLTSITMPKNYVARIYGWMFDGCTNLTAINVIAGNIEFSSQDGIVYNTDKTTLYAYPQGKTGAFTVPDSVTEIVNEAFSGCINLTAINVDAGNTALSSQDGVLYNKDKTTLIAYPGGKTGAFTIPTGVTGIGAYAFSRCTNLTGVTIPSGVTSIGTGVFSDCTNLTGVTILSGVTNIEARAFQNCQSLTSINIPDSVTYIGYSAFSQCDKLASVTFQGTITQGNFDSYSFNGDLRTKYLAANGGIGTYTTTAPVTSDSVWTKE